MNTLVDASLRPSHACLLAALHRDGAAKSFGPLWKDADYVLQCLAKYGQEEGRVFTGWTVAQIAVWGQENPYDLNGEEMNALACLLSLGKGETIVPYFAS